MSKWIVVGLCAAVLIAGLIAGRIARPRMLAARQRRNAGRPLPGPCVYCGNTEGQFKDHCGTGDAVCVDDDACLHRGLKEVL